MTEQTATTEELLEKLKALLADESCWTQAVYARTSNGSACKALNEGAVCWCLSGAMRKVVNVEGHDNIRSLNLPFLNPSYVKLHRALITMIVNKDFYHKQMAAFNDNNTYPKVMSVIDAALAHEHEVTKSTPND